MGHPYHHALSSVRRRGGVPEDNQPIHDRFDAPKAITADFRHRALRHRAKGVFASDAVFGTTIMLRTGRIVPVPPIGERHVVEDLGFIPSFADWMRSIRPERWMARGRPLHVEVDPFARREANGGASVIDLPRDDGDSAGAGVSPPPAPA